jgi:peptidoglycan-associated lipoprotein
VVIAPNRHAVAGSAGPQFHSPTDSIMTKTPFALVASIVVLPLIIGACNRTAKPAAVTPAPQPIPAAAAQSSSRPATEIAPTVPTAEATLPNATAEREATRSALEAAIYFETNSSLVANDAQSILDRKREALTREPAITLIITGHADERGDDEFNFALGKRRAEAAKQYLVDREIKAARVCTRTRGREEPAVPGHNEEAWALNRRAEFVVGRGASCVLR